MSSYLAAVACRRSLTISHGLPPPPFSLQNQSLAAAQQASDALAAIQGLASMQAAAQQALANAVTQQVTAIKSATFSKIITITQALALWKKARRDEAVTAKVRGGRAGGWTGRKGDGLGGGVGIPDEVPSVPPGGGPLPVSVRALGLPAHPYNAAEVAATSRLLAPRRPPCSRRTPARPPPSRTTTSRSTTASPRRSTRLARGTWGESCMMCWACHLRAHLDPCIFLTQG